MSKRQVTDCDRCGAKAVPEPATVRATVGRVCCPAGGASEPDAREIDLCPACAAGLLQAAVSALDFDAAAKWYDGARRRKT